jgi:drug/metabolite transporter (DMT)-like permease
MAATDRPVPAPAGTSVPAGIALVCAGMLCLSVNDALAKWLGAFYSPLQIIFLRAVVGLPLAAAVVLGVRGRAAFATRHPVLHLVRGAMYVAAAFTFFLGLQHLPLAEATAIAFASPILVTGLSALLLKESVGPRRWAAVLAGFAGVLIIVRPGSESFQPAALLPLASALLYALVMISARRIGASESMWTMMFYVIAGPLLFSAFMVPLVWRVPAWEHMPYFVAIAVFGTAAITLISQGFRVAPAAVVAPFDYTGLIWAALFGWMFWREVPDLWTVAGAAVIAASTLYIGYRESRAKGGADSPGGAPEIRD